MPETSYTKILAEASKTINNLKNRTIDVLSISKPSDIETARQLSKVISKLSPLMGNMIEFNTVSLLNKECKHTEGIWIRQDPGFPDASFSSQVIIPNPGIEIKTWFPFATEITARFKDSVSRFRANQINVAMIAWIPEFIIWGQPIILDIWIDSAYSVALARDIHYSNPPDYLVIEPEDTSSRTANLQQSNTNGYKLQQSEKLEEAKEIVKQWGEIKAQENHFKENQNRLRSLLGKYKYRLDTNFAKMDRIEHKTLEAFKKRVLDIKYKGLKIKEWSALLEEKTANKKKDKMLKQIISMI